MGQRTHIFVLNITIRPTRSGYLAYEEEQPIFRLQMIDSSPRTRPKERSRLKWPPKPAKVRRVTGVVVDQHISCPQCGDLMHLSGDHTFRCKQCGWDVTAEDAIKVEEAAAANWGAAASRQRN